MIQKIVVFLSCIFLFSLPSQSAPNDRIDETDTPVGVLELPEGDTDAPVALLLNKTGEEAYDHSEPLRDALRARFPACPMECETDWPGDHWCDTECAIEECGNDGGDCEGWCAPDCKESWLGDGFCDRDCFRAECRWDGGDCDGKYEHGDIKFPPLPHDKFDYSKCPASCDRELLNNLECNDACNIRECNFDGLDCRQQCTAKCANMWLGDGDCDVPCNTKECGFDKGDCVECSEKCIPWKIGNGVCDPECFNEACSFDMGDCMGVCWSEEVDYETDPFFYPHCRDEWTGDGFCDCFCLNEHCKYDHGDCNKANCTAEIERLKAVQRRLNITGNTRPLTHGRRLKSIGKPPRRIPEIYRF